MLFAPKLCLVGAQYRFSLSGGFKIYGGTSTLKFCEPIREVAADDSPLRCEEMIAPLPWAEGVRNPIRAASGMKEMLFAALLLALPLILLMWKTID